MNDYKIDVSFSKYKIGQKNRLVKYASTLKELQYFEAFQIKRESVSINLDFKTN